MEKSVLDTICASLDTFFESERKISTYIIQHTAKVVDMTVGELAQACGVSDASVSRFCKKIDMKGFHHLKITLAKEISERGKEEEEVSNRISVNDIGQSLKNILANKVTEITQTVSMMDIKQLHEILDKLKAKGVEIIYVTLNVGLGTFRPVKCENVLDHKMHSETFEITQEAADSINNAKSQGKKIVAVGTTTVRTLETAYQKYGCIKACHDHSELFIYPPYEFKVIDELITNFHLPKSTLLMLVSALAGKEFIFEAYKKAVEEKYYFFSYGDCMLIK